MIVIRIPRSLAYLSLLFLSACATTMDDKPLHSRPSLTNTTTHAKKPSAINPYQYSSDNLLNTLDPNVASAEEAFTKADQALTEGKNEKAFFYYVRVLQFEPHNIEALENIAILHQQNNRPDLALRVYQDLVKWDPKNVLANETLGLNYLSNRLNEQAKQHLTTAVQQDNSLWQSHNGLGIIADLEQQYDVAIQHYQAALANNAGSPMLLNNIGYSYYLKGDNSNARNYFSQALSFDSHYERATYNLALVEIKTKNYKKAETLLNGLMPLHETYNTIGYLCMLNGDYPMAEKYLNQAISEAPTYFPKAQENLEQLHALE